MLEVGSTTCPTSERTCSGIAEPTQPHSNISTEPAISYPRAPERVPPSKTSPIVCRSAESLPERITVAKTSPSYRAHSYHTKVPVEAIIPFIRAFSNPGDTICDPFCGSGMTGVAALMEGRNALLSDLSPAAVHIARNYTTPCDSNELLRAFERLERIAKPIIDRLYRIGNQRLVEYTTWSDVYRCNECLNLFAYWDVVQKTGGVDGNRIACIACGCWSRKADLGWIGEKPVVTHTSTGGNRIESHETSSGELALIEETSLAPIPYWFPHVPFGPEREMWRASHQAMGISNVSQFFTRRNLHALAALRDGIISVAEGRIREALLFAFTACVNRASRRYQWNAKRPTNVMTGTLYISSLRYEWNVWSLFRRKFADVVRYYERFPVTHAQAQVFERSATDLNCLPDRSVDMVFMDPPFGSNIFYADVSLLWEAWLETLTDTQSEIVVNRHRSTADGGKSIEQYGALLRASFEHAARILRPGGRAVLAFSNSDDLVWDAVQRALADSGLSTTSVHLLDKGQPSIKGVKGLTGKEHVTSLDLLLCLRHGKSRQSAIVFPPPVDFVDDVLRDAHRRGITRSDERYSSVIRALVEANYSLVGITMPMIQARCMELGTFESDPNAESITGNLATVIS